MAEAWRQLARLLLSGALLFLWGCAVPSPAPLVTAEHKAVPEIFESDEFIVVFAKPGDTLRARARVSLDCGCALPGRVLHRCADERERDASTAGAWTHGDARNDPDILVVDARRGARRFDAPVFGPQSDRDPAHGLVALERKKSRCSPPTCELRHRFAPLRTSHPLPCGAP